MRPLAFAQAISLCFGALLCALERKKASSASVELGDGYSWRPTCRTRKSCAIFPSMRIAQIPSADGLISLAKSGRPSNKLYLDHYHLTGYSRNHFLRMCREATGCTPHQYFLQLRIEKAQSLMKNRFLRIVDIADSCGFTSQSQFSRVFRKVVGLTPSQYRRDTL